MKDIVKNGFRELLVTVALICLFSVAIFAVMKSCAPSISSAQELDLSVPSYRSPDKIVTTDPGVHHFDVENFPKVLADWIRRHPEHSVTAMAPAPRRGYYVVTRVDPRFLNNVLPGAKPPIGARPPLGMKRPTGGN